MRLIIVRIGPFTANTSQPLLFVSNTLDPVTPLDGAQKVSHRFPGSVVLQQDCEGVCIPIPALSAVTHMLTQPAHLCQRTVTVQRQGHPQILPDRNTARGRDYL